jgi:hypothetical protein
MGHHNFLHPLVSDGPNSYWIWKVTANVMNEQLQVGDWVQVNNCVP